MRLPRHIGIIPDGNRRWAEKNGFSKEAGYAYGLAPGIEVFKLCQKLGIEELTFYGFTVDNTKRPSYQKNAFSNACVEAVKLLSKENASLLVVGNSNSSMFPTKLLPFMHRKTLQKGGVKVNFLVNYGWEWDLMSLSSYDSTFRKDIYQNIQSKNISRIDLIIRWGGRRRLSGFLPVQSIYSDFYIVDDLWPDFKEIQFINALEWYSKQDITLGG